MKRLVCEMCGGTDLIKQDGVFVCQNCGTKYSVEDARKMMVEVEGTVDVSGSTVKVDRQNEIEQLKNLMMNAFDSNNHAEAVTYATRVLEIDSNDYLAHYVKGTSSGWQSSIANPRLQEAANCWSSALACVPLEGEEAKDLCRRINNDLASLSSAMMTMYFKHYLRESTDSGATSSFNRINNLNVFGTSTALTLQIAYNSRLPEGEARMNTAAAQISSDGGRISLREFKTLLDENAENVYETIRIFKGGNLSQSAMAKVRTHMLWWMSCTSVLDLDDQESGLDYCISMYEKTGRVLRGNQFTDGIVSGQIAAINREKPRVREEKQKKLQRKQQRIREEQKRIAEAQEREKQERIAAYWAERSEEKAELESRKAQLLEERKPYFDRVQELQYKMVDLKKKTQEIPEESQKEELRRQLDELRLKRTDLGVFQGKEKKRLDAEIGEMQSKLKAMDELIEQKKREIAEKVDAQMKKYQEELQPYSEKLREFDAKIAEIDKELTMDR